MCPKTIQKLWDLMIAHKLQAMEIALNIFGIYMQHLESLSKTDSQAVKRAKIEGEVKR